MIEITLSISEQRFIRKPSNFNCITYHKETLSFPKLICSILEGRTLCHVFNKDSFKVSEKTISNFLYTNLIFIDCDDSELTIEQCFNKLSRKPNIAYTTFSNGIKGNRFRLIYITEYPIRSNDEYKEFIEIILKSISNDLGNNFIDCIDKSLFNVSQQIIGNSHNTVIYTNTDYLFNKNTFTDKPNHDASNDYNGDNHYNDLQVSKEHQLSNINSFNINQQEHKQKDNIRKCTKNRLPEQRKRGRTLNRMSEIGTLVERVDEFLNRHPSYFPKLSNADSIVHGDDYYTDVDSMGIYEVTFLYKEKKLVKIKVGKRSKFLFACGLKLLKINPSMDIVELCSALYKIYKFACEVSDDMNLKHICITALNCYEYEGKSIRNVKFKRNPSKLKIEEKERRKELGKAMKKKRDNKILPNYDMSKSVKENAKELGVSEKTIYRSFKDNNIVLKEDKYSKFCELYESGLPLSVREMSEKLGISKSTVMHYKKKYIGLK